MPIRRPTPAFRRSARARRIRQQARPLAQLVPRSADAWFSSCPDQTPVRSAARRRAAARPGRSVTRTSTSGLASNRVIADSSLTVHTIVARPWRRQSARRSGRARRCCTTAQLAPESSTASSLRRTRPRVRCDQVMRRLGQVGADRQPGRHGRLTLPEVAYHRRITGGEDQAGRRQQPQCLRHDPGEAVGILEVDVRSSVPLQQLQQPAGRRDVVVGEPAELRVSHCGDGLSTPGACIVKGD